MKSIVWVLLSLVFVHEAQGIGDYDTYGPQFYRDVEPHARAFFGKKCKKQPNKKFGMHLVEHLSQNVKASLKMLKDTGVF